MAETIKSHNKRIKEGWFIKYAPEQLSGIDIGCGRDPLNPTFRRWDQIYRDGDAQKMDGVPDNKFHTVYASHILEHLHNPIEGIKNWYRICKPEGHVVICVPHRDLYEKRKTLPSKWNGDHKTFWLPETNEAPVTRSLKHTILTAVPNANIVSLRVLDEGWVSESPDKHSGGEYSIEAIIKKPGALKVL